MHEMVKQIKEVISDIEKGVKFCNIEDILDDLKNIINCTELDKLDNKKIIIDDKIFIIKINKSKEGRKIINVRYKEKGQSLGPHSCANCAKVNIMKFIDFFVKGNFNDLDLIRDKLKSEDNLKYLQMFDDVCNKEE